MPLGVHGGFKLAKRAYLALRPFAQLFAALLQLAGSGPGAGCAKLAQQPMAAVAGVQERLRVEERSSSTNWGSNDGHFMGIRMIYGRIYGSIS